MNFSDCSMYLFYIPYLSLKLKLSQVYKILAENLGLAEESMLLNILVNKM